MDLREQKFGIEIEMTGITRARAAQVTAEYFSTEACHAGGYYDKYVVEDTQHRSWNFVSDASIECQKKQGNRRVAADRSYSVEMVSPICTYGDIPVIQELVRKLRDGGAFPNNSVGIHIHVNAAPFTASQLRNLVNIVASKEDIIYKALQVESQREQRYCRKVDENFLERLNRLRPKSMEALQRLWYNGADESHVHYSDTRYRCVNLHSVFSKGTIEFRAFNSGDGSIKQALHAGKIKAYIQFCLAITAQAYNQRSASPVKTQTTNEKYTFRTWLLRLGMIGDEFKTARAHLLGHLEGNIAWKTPEQAQAQRDRLRLERQNKAHFEQNMEQELPPMEVADESVQEESMEICM